VVYKVNSPQYVEAYQVATIALQMRSKVHL
jgi:hypothetical protein